jgi:hypothetical protein
MIEQCGEGRKVKARYEINKEGGEMSQLEICSTYED